MPTPVPADSSTIANSRVVKGRRPDRIGHHPASRWQLRWSIGRSSPTSERPSPRLVGDRGQDGGGQHAGGLGGIETAGVDLLGGTVHQAVEGGHQPGARQVGTELPLVLAAGDEPLDAGHGLVVVLADADGAEVPLRGGEPAAVLVEHPPGRADQAGHGVGGGTAVDRHAVEHRVRLGQRVGEDGLHQLLPGREVAVEGDPADAGAPGLGASRPGWSCRVVSEAMADRVRGQCPNAGRSPAGDRPGGSSHGAATALAPAITAQARKASPKPATAAAAAAGPASTPAAAIVDTSATPRAAPSSWAVFTRPETMPAWSGSTLVIAVMVAVTSAMPSPAPASANPGRTPVSASPPAGTPAKSAMPAAASANPAAATGRRPSRPTRCAAAWAPATIATATGRKTSPVRSAPRPMTRCSSSEERKNPETSRADAASITP